MENAYIEFSELFEVKDWNTTFRSGSFRYRQIGDYIKYKDVNYQRNFMHDQKLTLALYDQIEPSLVKSMENRKAILADPSEILKALDLENFTIEGLEAKLKEILNSMDANLPDKLMLPISLFYVGRNMATRTRFSEHDISMSYHEDEPAEFPGGPSAYKLMLDQTYLNLVAKDLIKSHTEFSLRKTAKLFGSHQLLTTSLLSLNMPAIATEYGSDTQFDLLSTLEFGGFSFDKSGHIKGKMEVVTLLKLFYGKKKSIIGRTVRSTLAVSAEVVSEDGKFIMDVEGLEIEKIHVTRGEKAPHDDEDFGEDDDEVEGAPDQSDTREGKNVQTLFNEVVKPMLKDYFPRFE